jgi:hypothetical protein
MVVENVKSYAVWKALSAWTDREREKRIAVINQGVLSPAERKALKLKDAIAKEEKRRNAELIAAQKDEAEILEEARERVFPVITPKDEDDRAAVIADYAAFHASRPNRKRGSVIRWKLKQLREQVKGMTTEKREYQEQPTISRFARRRRTLKSKTTVLRRKGDTLKYAALTFQIGQLEKQLDALYPPLVRTYGDGENITRYRVDSFIDKRPKEQTYSVPWYWERPEHRDSRETLAARLREARASIRALTPPADEDEGELPLAA